MQQPAKLSSFGMPGFESRSLRKNFVIDQSGCSVARSSRLLWEQEVAGSNPATPTTIGRVAQLDRASAF